MEAIDSFRPGLLEGRAVAAVGGGELATAVAEACRALGASATLVGGGHPEDAAAALADHDGPRALVVDAAGLFASAGGGADADLAPLRAALDGAWEATHAAATAAMIGHGGGQVVLLAPAPSAGAHAGATRDGLENLARVLSIEWARHDIRVVAIHPSDATRAAEVAGLVAFLVSHAGDYYSGCRLSLA